MYRALEIEPGQARSGPLPILPLSANSHHVLEVVSDAGSEKKGHRDLKAAASSCQQTQRQTASMVLTFQRPLAYDCFNALFVP